MIKAVTWIRKNLLSSPLDVLLTFSVLLVLYFLVPAVLRWAIFDASWAGEKRADCTGSGACWVFVKSRYMQFLYGFYPDGQRWRVNVVGALFILGVGPLFVQRFPWKKLFSIVLLTIYPFVAYFLLVGDVFGLEHVETSKWGGLMVTLIISVVGIVGSLPLGIVLALGRRSKMPVLQKFSVAFIELWRGVPLITVLFMASVMLPLFMPAGMSFDKFVRALVGVTLFSSAYMAEVVRGGLQAVGRGQYEAAQALGVGYWNMMGLVILPQALRKVIPGIVNSFISLFKDTTLVLIIGMFDLLGMVQTATTDPEWLGLAVEGYVFAGVIYWVFCFSMSRFSMRLERRYADAERSGVGA